MLNLTTLSLSLTSIYSFSPLFSGQRLFFEKTTISYNFPLIFLYPYQLQVQKSIFSHGLGAFIHSDFVANDYYQDKDFDFISGSSPIRFTDSKKELIVIRDCNFLEIKYQSYGNYITISQSKTFYITDCTFYKYSSKKIFFLHQIKSNNFFTYL